MAIIIAVFVWYKALSSSRERRERIKREGEIWRRDYELRQKFAVLTEEKFKETSDPELLHGVAMNIQTALENELNMNEAFTGLPKEKQYIYTLEYFDEDAQKSLSAFFKNNGYPLLPVIPDALNEIGAAKYTEYVVRLLPMYDPDSDVSIDYGIVAKTDEQFGEIYDSRELCKLAALYIRKNKDIFLK